MHWNYRIMKRKDNRGDIYYGLVEVYYGTILLGGEVDEDAISWTEQNIITGKTLKEITETLEMMLNDVQKQVLILDECELEKEHGIDPESVE